MGVTLPKKSIITFMALIALGVGVHLLPLLTLKSNPQELSAFTIREKDGTPVIWDRHVGIKILLHGDNLSKSNRRLVEKSLAWLNQVLGVQGTIIGSTDMVATSNWFKNSTYGRIPPVNISFISRSESDLFIDSATLAATVANPNRGPHSRIITGAIAVDILAVAALSQDQQELVLRHELGHLMGFGHDLGDLMNPVLRSARSQNLSADKIAQFKGLN